MLRNGIWKRYAITRNEGFIGLVIWQLLVTNLLLLEWVRGFSRIWLWTGEGLINRKCKPIYFYAESKAVLIQRAVWFVPESDDVNLEVGVFQKPPFLRQHLVESRLHSFCQALVLNRVGVGQIVIPFLAGNPKLAIDLIFLWKNGENSFRFFPLLFLIR